MVIAAKTTSLTRCLRTPAFAARSYV